MQDGTKWCVRGECWIVSRPELWPVFFIPTALFLRTMPLLYRPYLANPQFEMSQNGHSLPPPSPESHARRDEYVRSYIASGGAKWSTPDSQGLSRIRQSEI